MGGAGPGRFAGGEVGLHRGLGQYGAALALEEAFIVLELGEHAVVQRGLVRLGEGIVVIVYLVPDGPGVHGGQLGGAVFGAGGGGQAEHGRNSYQGVLKGHLSSPVSCLLP